MLFAIMFVACAHIRLPFAVRAEDAVWCDEPQGSDFECLDVQACVGERHIWFQTPDGERRWVCGPDDCREAIMAVAIATCPSLDDLKVP